MKHKDFYADIKELHKNIVAETVALMVEHGVTEIDLLGSDHAYVMGYPGDGADVMEMEVSKVYYRDCQLWLDVILDIDTEELAEQNENGDIGDAYQCWRANDFEHFKPCGGIELVYESVWQVLEHRLPRVTEPEPKKPEPWTFDEQAFIERYCPMEGGNDYLGWIDDICKLLDGEAEPGDAASTGEYADYTEEELRKELKRLTTIVLTQAVEEYVNRKY